MFDIHEIIDMAVLIKKNGQSVYKEAVKRTESTEQALLLEWIISEESRQIDWLLDLQVNLKRSAASPRTSLRLTAEVLDELLEDQIFSLEDSDLTKMETARDLLKRAIEFEKDTILFYQMLLLFLDSDATTKQLQAIIVEEKRHLELLEGSMECVEDLETGGN